MPCFSSNLRTIVFGLLSALLYSCASESNDIAVIKEFEQSIINSNKVFSHQTEMIYASLNDKLMEPRNRERASRWVTKATLVQKYSSEINAFIESLKTALKDESGFSGDDGETFRQNTKGAVKAFYAKNNRGKELYERLKKYKGDLLALDAMMTKQFADKIRLTTITGNANRNEEESFTQHYFNQRPSVALALLNHLLYNVRYTENRMLLFMNENATAMYCGFPTYSAIIAQDSRYVRAGEQIEITAGMGAFSKAAQPRITINGHDVPLSVDGAAHFKFRAAKKAGKHYVLTRIEYTDQEGKKQAIAKEVEYTVAHQ